MAGRPKRNSRLIRNIQGAYLYGNSINEIATIFCVSDNTVKDVLYKEPDMMKKKTKKYDKKEIQAILTESLYR